MQRRRRGSSAFHLTFLVSTSCVLTIIGLIGCGSGDVPPLGDVHGTVTLDGEPLEKGRILFAPADGGRTSEAPIGEGGHYELIYSLDEFGAKVGSHTVQVTTQDAYGRGERIPEKYNADSELTAEVEPGGNEYNFDLTSD